MSGPTRDRGCFYYVPWVATLSTAVLTAAITIWIIWTQKMYNDTNSGLNELGISAQDFDRPKPIVIGTSAALLAVVLFVIGLAVSRSFIEAAHDSTGQAGAGSKVFLWLSWIAGIPWTLIVIWTVLVGFACTIWAGLLYVTYRYIDQLLATTASLPPGVWVPSAGQICPPTCLDLSYFSYLDFNYEQSCVCDRATLAAASADFQSGFNNTPYVVSSIYILFLACLALLIDLATNYSHTLREREFLHRLSVKQFLSV